MGATAALLLKTNLAQLDSGAVTRVILGWTGLLAVVAAGWTTATPNIYRAALSFATFFPKATLRQLSFGVGAVIAVSACFPAMMQVDKLVSYVVWLLSSVGAVCLVEHWIFPRIGFTRFWCLYRGLRINPAALGAWGVSSAFIIAALVGGWMHPFFLFLPSFLIAAVAYVAFAALFGARAPVPPDVWKDVNAVEARVAALAEEDAAAEDAAASAAAPVRSTSLRLFRFLPVLVLALLAGLAVAVSAGGLSAQTFRTIALVLTGVYFAVHAIVAKIK